MSYTALWKPAAEGQLADLWTAAADRDAVAAAADAIDDLLRRDPFAVGESRAGSRRILFVEPPAVDYEVQE